MAASFAWVDDANGNTPYTLLSECESSPGSPISFLTTVTIQNIGVIASDRFMALCGSNDPCLVPEGLTL